MKLKTYIASLAGVIFIASPLAAQQPVQWHYSFNQQGVATATYPGEIVVTGQETANGPVVMNGTVTVNGEQTNTRILQIDMGTSSVPAFWTRTNLAAAWPGVLVENLSTSPNAQAQLFFRLPNPVTGTFIWQFAHDADNSGQKHLFAIEPIDPNTGVTATPFIANPQGEVAIGGKSIPRVGQQLTVGGDIRIQRSSTGYVDGAIQFGDNNAAQIYGTQTGAVVTLINGFAFQTVNGSGVTIAGTLELPEYTFAVLPTCNAGARNRLAVVSDALAPAWNTAIAGGGTVRVLAFCNGVAWTAH